MDFPATIIEPGIGQWRSADIGEDELPTDLRFHDDVAFSPLDAIFDARVTKVDTALDMAFLDLGTGRTGVMNFRRARLLVKGQAKSIGACLSEGQMIRVQVLSEPSALEGKALPVTPRPRLTGRYLVAETGAARLNFSKDLTARRTKDLKALIAPLVQNCALIIRSRAGLVPMEAITAEATRLMAALTAPIDKPRLVHAWTPAEKALLAAPDGDTVIYTEGGSDFAAVKTLAGQHWPDLHARLKPYSGSDSAFEALGVNEAIDEALRDRIILPSGGWISITPTPALTAVDVNMGGALKGMSAGEAKLVVNMEATLALAYHLRFQDIGGIIVVDYITMSGKGSTRDLMRLIERTFSGDIVPVQHTGLSAFGLVEFTRKRSGLSLRDRMLQARAPVSRIAALAFALLGRAVREGQSNQVGTLVITGSQKLLDWLSNHSALTADLKSRTGRALLLEVASKTDTFIRS